MNESNVIVKEKKINKKKVIILIVIIAIAAIVLTTVLRKAGGGSENVAYVVSVEKLMSGNDGTQNRYAGVVETQKTWDIVLDSGQKVGEVYVKEGDEVKVGQKLFKYDTSELSLSIDKAQLDLDELNGTIEEHQKQIKQLTAEKATVSADAQYSYTTEIQLLENEIKQTEFDIEAKQAELQRLQDSMEHTEVTSEIEGVVTKVGKITTNSEEEEPSMDDEDDNGAFMSIMQNGNYHIKAQINETNVWMLETGMHMLIYSRVSDEMWTGTVATLDTNSKVQGNSNNYGFDEGDDTISSTKYPFYVELDSSEGLMLGQHVYMEIDNGQGTPREGVWLFSGYLLEEEDGGYSIWVDDKGNLKRQKVEVGEYDEALDQYQIVSGLSKEDYVAWPDADYRSGMKTTKTKPQSSDGEGLSADDEFADDMFTDEEYDDFTDDGDFEDFEDYEEEEFGDDRDFKINSEFEGSGMNAGGFTEGETGGISLE